MSKTETFICLHGVGCHGRHYPPGAEIELSDQPEIERLISLGAIITLDEFESRRSDDHFMSQLTPPAGGS